ncbi:hypothetical protein [Herbiconiux daphne]|uniref:DUF559 domain-containing protein n=1 Tax=Herbiconiux daphne TaxID=2970914 RepID=A0ABT2H8D4_9MICO|nr:hypothetical protein [Herbiconiux daphne]MCS5736164.1 hypothetical protein [Herbiconiux daphne]
MPHRSVLPYALRDRAFTTAEGRAAGVGEQRMRGPDLAAPFPGVRMPRDDAPGLLPLCRALDLRLRADTAFSHATAALLWHVPLPERLQQSVELHVSTVAPATRVRVHGVVGHTSPCGTPFERRYGLRVTGPADTFIALAGVLSFDDLVAAGDHLVLTPRYDTAERRPYVPLLRLAERVSSYSGRHARRVREAFAAVRDGAESRQETRLRLAMVRRGLPEPLLNRDIHDLSGELIGRADMVYPFWRVIVEYDGDHHRTDAAQHDRDITRREEFALADYRYVSVRKYGMTHTPDSGAARAERALRLAGWRP